MFKVLFLVAFIAVLAFPSEAVFSNDLMLSVRPKLIQCAVENNISEAELKAIIANDLSNQNTNIQGLALCFMQALGMFDKEGNINVEASIALFSQGENPAFVAQVVNKCKVLKGRDASETAAAVYACYVHEQLL